MGTDVSGRQLIFSRIRKIAAATALTGFVAAAAWLVAPGDTVAGGETRSISLYHVHTKESLTITYMVNGRYVPSALSKINYLMRDWRRNEVTKIDPKTIDLMWELHADLGSKAPVHIICGYRSAKTNGFLKRIGRNVARRSQHILGKAIDLYFPDVNTQTIRNSALVREVGGVGYYRSAGGPTGFLHIDSGRVRHWGPAISRTQMARIFREYRKTVGARAGGKYEPPASTPEPSDSNNIAYDGVDEDIDEAADAKPAPTPRVKPEGQAPGEIAQGYPVPIPREKPIEVLMLAAANLQIVPASAPPPRVNFNEGPRPAGNTYSLAAAEPGIDDVVGDEPVSNTSAKGSFGGGLAGIAPQPAPLIKPLAASAGNTDLFLSSAELVFSTAQSARRDYEQPGSGDPVVAAKSAMEANPPGMAVASLMLVSTAANKGDLLLVNRSTKGSLLGVR
jgi:uncharacterized protein YcbK (DUF882 family)